MGGSGLTLDLFLGGIVTVLLLFLLILKEFASAAENPDWRRIGKWLYIPIIPLLFLFFLLAGYRVLVVLNLLPELRSEDPETFGPVVEASEMVAPLVSTIVNLDPTQSPGPTATNSLAVSETPLPMRTTTEIGSPTTTLTVPPLPQADPTLPAPTRSISSPILTPPPELTPTSPAPSPALTPTLAPTTSEETP